MLIIACICICCNTQDSAKKIAWYRLTVRSIYCNTCIQSWRVIHDFILINDFNENQFLVAKCINYINLYTNWKWLAGLQQCKIRNTTFPSHTFYRCLPTGVDMLLYAMCYKIAIINHTINICLYINSFYSSIYSLGGAWLSTCPR